MKFLHAADVHLDSPLRGLERYEGAPVEEIRGATRQAFANLVDLAIEEEVAFVLLAGDLYDGDWKDYNTGLFFTRQMGRLQEADIRAFVIAGNHDAASQITKVLRPPENVHVFSTAAPETVSLQGLGVAIHGQGFRTRSVTQDLSQAYPLADPHCFNLGLLHTSLDGRPGHDAYAPCTVEGLRSRGYQYWARGHVHRREVVAEDPWIVFPGNLQGRHARETGSKGATLVVVEDHQVKSVVHRALDVVRWEACSADLAATRSLDEVYDRVQESLAAVAGEAEGRLLAVRLQLDGACASSTKLRARRDQVVAECRAIASTLGEGVLWVEKVVIGTRSTESEAAMLARDDAFGGLLRAVHDLELDQDRLARLGEEVADLTAKLPLELRSGEEAFDPTKPGFIRDSLQDVKELLVERLLSHGGED